MISTRPRQPVIYIWAAFTKRSPPGMSSILLIHVPLRRPQEMHLSKADLQTTDISAANLPVLPSKSDAPSFSTCTQTLSVSFVSLPPCSEGSPIDFSPPIEVLEQILNFIKGSQGPYDHTTAKTLAACCLVCKAFVPRSRYLLHQDVRIELQTTQDLERFIRSLKASPSLCGQVRVIDIDPTNHGRVDQSWISCALLQLSTYDFGARLCLDLRAVDVQVLNPMALRGWTRRRLKRILLEEIPFTRYSQLQPFLSAAEEVQLKHLRFDLPANHHFGTLIAPVHHTLRHLSLQCDLPVAAMLMNTSWFRSSRQLVQFKFSCHFTDPEHNMPYISVIVTRALEVAKHSRLLAVHLVCISGWKIHLDPHGITNVELVQERLWGHLLYITAIFQATSLTVALPTLRLQVIIEDSRNELRVDPSEWSDLDDALISPVNASTIQNYELTLSYRYGALVSAESVPRLYRCTNDIIQKLLPKFTSRANCTPVNAHCISCGLHDRRRPADAGKHKNRGK
ncbi:hypothetical protein EIP91_002408 [Steccherinum ochraceum]|uniref:Uncharacterized protein n=1 Tax=Steccherinum ochraceum TaxID=92696 RepID=A0A4R0RC79_9APHY|nr:hypothetical protein EIP91_002408 [Steccherinum ochraceum]